MLKDSLRFGSDGKPLTPYKIHLHCLSQIGIQNSMLAILFIIKHIIYKIARICMRSKWEETFIEWNSLVEQRTSLVNEMNVSVIQNKLSPSICRRSPFSKPPWRHRCSYTRGSSLWGDMCRFSLSIDPDMTPDDPRWIGAWWLGSLVLAVVIFFSSLPLTLFPRNLQTDEAVARHRRSRHISVRSQGGSTLLVSQSTTAELPISPIWWEISRIFTESRKSLLNLQNKNADLPMKFENRKLDSRSIHLTGWS